MDRTWWYGVIVLVFCFIALTIGLLKAIYEENEPFISEEEEVWDCCIHCKNYDPDHPINNHTLPCEELMEDGSYCQ